MKNSAQNVRTSFIKLKAVLQTIGKRTYPLPAVLPGYVCGLLIALLPRDSGSVPPSVYAPLPFQQALPAALSAELPFWIASVFLIWIKPAKTVGMVLAALKGALCGFGAELLLLSGCSLFGYFRYVTVSLLLTAHYTCLIRKAVDASQLAGSKGALCECLVEMLFCVGSALLLLPLKFIPSS